MEWHPAPTGFGFMRVYKPLRKISSTEPVYVRARLERARIKEQYFYFQEISQNADRHMEKGPVGQIELVLPYDGDQYFSRQARKDVDHAGRLRTDLPAEVSHWPSATDRVRARWPRQSNGPWGQRTVRSPSSRYPSRVCPGRISPIRLMTDRSACVLTHKYQPDSQHFKVDPVDVDAQLHDPDDAQFSSLHVASYSDGQRLRIMRQVGFKPELRLQMRVHLDFRVDWPPRRR